MYSSLDYQTFKGKILRKQIKKSRPTLEILSIAIASYLMEAIRTVEFPNKDRMFVNDDHIRMLYRPLLLFTEAI